MKILKFYKDTIEEFKKIEWPTRSELINLSIMVVFVSAFIGIYAGTFDFIFVALLKKIRIL